MKRKNIILIVSHDIGQHIGPYGVETVQTPNLDRMAEQGVVFQRNYCTSPGCSPSRAAIFTGRYPHSNGVMGLTHNDFLWRFHSEEKHLAQVLGDQGYDTCLVGVWHENNRIDNVGYQKTILRDGEDFVLCDEPARDERNILASDVMERTDYYLSQVKDSDQPFFLSAGFFEPHRPFDFMDCTPDQEKGVWVPPYIPQDTPEKKAAAEKEFAEIQGAIQQMDRGLGVLLDSLERHGLKDDTLVLFTADHGVAMPRAKCSLYDPGIETPLMLWGGGMPENVRHDCLISNVDYVPSLLEWAGVPVPENVQGRSFMPLLSGEEYTQRDAVFSEKTYHRSYDPIRCIRTEQYKYIINFEFNTAYDAPADIQRGEIYLTNIDDYMQPRPRYELYDLKDDPWEQNNLAEDAGMQPVRDELHGRLADWMKETEDPLLDGPVASIYSREILGQL